MNQKQNLRFLFLTFSLFLIVAIVGQAQEMTVKLADFNQVRIDYNKSGMIILGSWALGNIALGGIMAGRATGETKAFHQMNIYWNTVNLAIAGFGYYSAINELPGSELWETISAQHSIEKILLVNAALDIGYMAGGLYLLERGRRLKNDQFKSFGKSVILQGAFLMSFDTIKYVFHHVHGKELPTIMNHFGITPSGFGLLMNF